METLQPTPSAADIRRPAAGMTKAEKMSDGGKYFRDYARYIVYNYYNTWNAPSSIPGNAPVSIVAEQLNAFKYYYGYQDNRVFNYMTRTYGGGKIPAVWINGQHIRTFMDHIKGNVEGMVAPIREGMHVRSISETAILNMKSIFEPIERAAEYNELLKDLGAAFMPQGDIDYGNPATVDKVKSEIRTKHEETGTAIGMSLFYKNKLGRAFVDDGVQAMAGNLAGTYIYERNGSVEFQNVPCYNLINDYGSGGEFSEDAWFCGFIIPMSIEEVLARWPHMEPHMRDEIKKIPSGVYPGGPGGGGFENYSQFSDYYNAPFQNVRWWGNDAKFVSVAFTFWLDTQDIKFTSKVDAYGNKKTRRIVDSRDYNGENGETKKGYEIRGDRDARFVHKCVLVGNKWNVEYGYETYQVRPYGDKSRPQMPVHTYCPSKYAGYVRSMASRLIQNQDEIDRLSFKIQELTANDLGTVFFVRGDKVGEGTTPMQILDDLKSYRVHVLSMTGEEIPDNTGAKDIINRVDLSNNQYISSYIELKREQLREMENIASIPAPALGMQDRIIGKGVQEQTINQSSLAMTSFYSGLEQFWLNKMQYAINKQKLVYAKSPGQKILPISNSDVKIIEATKEMRFEDYFMYIEKDDSINAPEKAVMNQLLLAYAQGSQNELASARAMLNGLTIMKGKTFGESIKKLKKHVEELKVEAEQSYVRQMEVEHSQQQFAALSAQQAKLQEQYGDMLKLITKAMLDGAWGVQKVEAQRQDKEADEGVISEGAQRQQMAEAAIQPQQQGQEQEQGQ